MKKNDLSFYDLSANKWWDSKEKIYALYHLNQPRFEFFDRYVSNWQGLKALDVGCGGGFSCEFMAARGALVSGIDQSRKCIDTAQNHAAIQNLQIDYQQSLAENIPYPNNTFDVAICVDVLEHVEDWCKTISEIYRVLKPKGIFLFDTINRTFTSKMIMIWLLENLLKEIPQGIHDWKKFIQPREIIKVMQETGFTDIEIKGLDLFGKDLYSNILSYIRYKKTRGFQGEITNNTSLIYIGKAIKAI